MRRAWEAAHVRAGLGDEHLSAAPVDAGDGVNELKGPEKGLIFVSSSAESRSIASSR